MRTGNRGWLSQAQLFMMREVWHGSGRVPLVGTKFRTAKALYKLGLGYTFKERSSGTVYFTSSRMADDLMLIGTQYEKKHAADEDGVLF